MAERGTGIPVVVAGLGEIGRAIARSVLETPELRLVGAVDPDPGLAGRGLDEVLEAPGTRVPVDAEAGRSFAAARGGVLLQAEDEIAAVDDVVERAARVEFLKGLRALIDERIERVSRPVCSKGTTVPVE